MLHRIILLLLLGFSLVGCTSQPETYSEVIAQFPSSIEACRADVTLTNIVDGNWSVNGSWVIRNGVQTFECPGAKLTLNVVATINGKSYEAGTLLVMNHKNEWISVTTFD
jgi:hypothetical protein